MSDPGGTWKRLVFALASLIALIPAAGCSERVVAVVNPVDTARLILPNDIGAILVLVDRLPQGTFVETRAEQVAVGLQHFSTQTSWGYVDEVSIDSVASAAAV